MTVSRDSLERHQISISFAATLLGIWGAFALPGQTWRALINPTLAALLYVTFLQVPIVELRRGWTERRFLAALGTTNFLIAPLAATLLTLTLPDEPAVLRLGVLLVLLAPCIDYVVAFTHLAHGNARLLLAATPLLLVAQMISLPLFIGLVLGQDAARLIRAEPFLQALFWLIMVPLALTAATQFWAARQTAGRHMVRALSWLPVPLTAMTLLVIVAAVLPDVFAQADEVARLVPLYAAFTLAMPLAGALVGRGFALAAPAARALAFSGATRNSLVVLPVAFALPEAGLLLPAIIVTQTLVELALMPLLLHAIPKLLPGRSHIRS
ncbi:arsenic resistance protein [Pseudoroseomonas globiformis]|uniref:Arsenic resistance protein n=1 Tax=Teichococcus globiformis TaxID=2307229 RepID=A0ABV7G499_9PROT